MNLVVVLVHERLGICIPVCMDLSKVVDHPLKDLLIVTFGVSVRLRMIRRHLQLFHSKIVE